MIADLGLAAAERHESGGSDADLAEAVDHLLTALDAAPGHPDTPVWHYHLALALAVRAGANRSEADWDAAVEHLRTAQDEVGDDSDLVAEIAPDLALVLFRRFHGMLDGWDDARIAGECVALADGTDDLDTGSPYVTMIRGLVRLDAYRIGGDAGYRDEAIALLGAALEELDLADALVPEAYGEYALALDDVPAEADGDASARYARRDRAIEALERSLAMLLATDHPDLVLLDGELRCARGDDHDDPIEVRRGAERLAQFRVIADPDAPDIVYTWLMQALAHERLWHLTADPATQADVVACCDGALEAGAAGEMALDAHRLVLEVLLQRFDDGPAVHAEARSRFGAAVTALDAASDADAGARAELALAVASLGVRLFGSAPGMVDVDGLQRFAEIALRHPEPPSEWDARLAVLGVLRTLPGYREPALGEPRLPELAAVWGTSELGSQFPGEFAQLTAVTAYLDAFRSGDRARLRAARDLLAVRGGGESDEVDLLAALIDGTIAHQDGASEEENIQWFERMVAVAERDADDPWTARFLLPTFRSLVAALRRGTPVGSPMGIVDDRFGTFLDDLAAAMDSAGAVLTLRNDPDGLRRRLADDAQRCRSLDPGSVPRMAATTALGLGYLELARTWPSDARSAVEWCREALDSLPGPHHPLWFDRAHDLAESYRIRRQPGDLPLSRAAGLSALRGHAWQALLQAGTDHAVAAARTAAAAAQSVADWCAEDRDHEDVFRAVEAGRGLALHAATTTRSVAALLTGLGRDDLSLAWAAADGSDRLDLPGDASGVDLHGDLRRRVMSVLTAADPTLLDPPGLPRIRAALAALGHDVLVYLVPGDAGRVGRAVVVPVDAGVEVIDLPDLVVGPGTVMTAYAAAHLADPGDGEVGVELDQLLGWAWAAAAAHVVTAARRVSRGRLPRVVLVPVGVLGLVPWHAAARPAGAGVRYLVEDAVVSYAASGHLLCEVAERLPVEGGSAVVVGNPTNDLRAAGLEAQAVRAAFHPDAVYLGRVGESRVPAERPVAPDGAGTPEQVLDLVTDPARPCSVLHLACHAWADPSTPSGSRVVLAGGRPLNVGVLMERAPTAPLPLGTVVLAACSTTVAGVHYDEAFSLATAFLAAGARTAVGSLWSVPDEFTSRLVFMVHHHLGEGLRPVDAVRAAQLWMLDPDREPPPSMPRALAARTGRRGHEHPENWAAVTHLGW